ncbi:uncharacterized protein UHOD_04921 [Ustilago sp. UG-2017b]|nr:uncharacterized protein UHOD_04921 [Ustilago sp. UG-2017b]
MRTTLLIRTAALVVAGGVGAAPMLSGAAVGEVAAHAPHLPGFQSEIMEEAASHPDLGQWSSASSDEHHMHIDWNSAQHPSEPDGSPPHPFPSMQEDAFEHWATLSPRVTPPQHPPSPTSMLHTHSIALPARKRVREEDDPLRLTSIHSFRNRPSFASTEASTSFNEIGETSISSYSNTPKANGRKRTLEKLKQVLRRFSLASGSRRSLSSSTRKNASASATSGWSFFFKGEGGSSFN